MSETWLHKFKQSHELVEALADLQRMAANHHETLSAVTLFSVEKTMDILGDSMTGTLTLSAALEIADSIF